MRGVAAAISARVQPLGEVCKVYVRVTHMDEHAVALRVIHQGAPINVGSQSRRVPEHPQRVLGACERHVHSPHVAKEADAV